MPVRVAIRRGDETVSIELANPRGHAANPMSPAEIEDKFRRVVNPYLSEPRQDAVVARVDEVDSAETLGPLMRSLVF
jgi:2-methylcitrate dehydratase PrpD